MATDTVEAELAGVNIRLGMAARTVGRSAGHDRRRVASAAFLIGVRALQRKNSVMVKRHHGIMPIVAVQTVIAK